MLRFTELGRQGLWLDELASLRAANPDYGVDVLFQVWTQDVHPPAYYLALHGWLKLAGTSALALRAPSALCGAATVLAALLIGRRLLDGPGQVAFVGLSAVSLGGLQHAQEARPYAALLLFATISTGLLAKVVTSGEEDPDDTRRWLPAIALVATAMSLVHYFGALLGGVSLLVLFGRAVLRRDRASALAVLGWSLLPLGAVAGWLAIQGPALTPKLGGGFWIPDDPGGALRELGALALSTRAAVALVALLAAFRLVRGRTLWLDPIVVYCVVLGASVFTLAFAVSRHTPVLTGRNLIVLLPAIHLVLAAMISGLGRPRAGTVAAVLLTAVVLGGTLDGYYATRTEQWLESGQRIADLPGCGEGTFVISEQEESYYRWALGQVSYDLGAVDERSDAWSHLAFPPRFERTPGCVPGSAPTAARSCSGRCTWTGRDWTCCSPLSGGQRPPDRRGVRGSIRGDGTCPRLTTARVHGTGYL